MKFQNTECLTANAHFNRNMNGSHSLPALYWNRAITESLIMDHSVSVIGCHSIFNYLMNIKMQKENILCLRINTVGERFSVIFLTVLFTECLLQSAKELKRLAFCLGILEKYGKHLLKPLEQRSNMWRYIKFSNTIFRERVEPVQVRLSSSNNQNL